MAQFLIIWVPVIASLIFIGSATYDGVKKSQGWVRRSFRWVQARTPATRGEVVRLDQAVSAHAEQLAHLRAEFDHAIADLKDLLTKLDLNTSDTEDALWRESAAAGERIEQLEARLDSLERGAVTPIPAVDTLKQHAAMFPPTPSAAPRGR